MTAEVRTIWPTFIGDQGKGPVFLVSFGGPLPSYGQATSGNAGPVFKTRKEATDYAAPYNGHRSDDWIAS